MFNNIKKYPIQLMKIDTLVFSGASTKIPLFVGSLKALLEENYITDLQGIHHIIGCSSGALIALLLILGVSLQVIEQTMIQFDFSTVFSIEDTSIESLFCKQGLYDHSKCGRIITTVLRETMNLEDMTFQELYDHTKIKLSLKVVNITKSCIEYISYQTYPNLSIIQGLLMTTAIPYLFRPITYQDQIFIDGGACGGYPREIAGENYLGICVIGPWSSNDKEIYELFPILQILFSLQCISLQDQEIKEPRTILLYSSLQLTTFDVPTQLKQQMITQGYEDTKQHLTTYSLTKDPIETVE